VKTFQMFMYLPCTVVFSNLDHDLLLVDPDHATHRQVLQLQLMLNDKFKTFVFPELRLVVKLETNLLLRNLISELQFVNSVLESG
jgi:hypothetical protein